MTNSQLPRGDNIQVLPGVDQASKKGGNTPSASTHAGNPGSADRRRPLAARLAPRAPNVNNSAMSTKTIGLPPRRTISKQPLLPGLDEKLFQQNGSAFKDPAFADNKQLPIHRWVPWIAGFSAAFVDDVLDSYLGNGKRRERTLVLDPFTGVGTTLVQASFHGSDYVGFEINPYAALAARIKLRAPYIKLEVLDRSLKQMREAAHDWKTKPAAASARPLNFKSRIPFFSPRVERQVLHALEFIGKQSENDIAHLYRVAFGSVMVSVSNYTYEPSLGSRPGAGKPLIEDADVAEVLLTKLHQMRGDILWVQEETGHGTKAGHGEVHSVDFFQGHTVLPVGSVDLMVTSPPYLNNYHYVRNTRPQLYWLSLVSGTKDQRHLEEENFGKFWQTVRDAEELPLAFAHCGLTRLLSDLRKVRADAGPYGGPGWANYAAAYFNDCQRFALALNRVLTKGGAALVVIGNSILQGLEVRTDEILADLATQQGLKTEGIHRNRGKRVGASITQSTVRRGETNSSVLYESTVVLRKP